MKRILLLLTILSLFSCKEETVQQKDKTPIIGAKFTDQLEVTTNRKVTLLPEAKEEVSQWLAYVTAQNEIESLRTSTGRDILDTSNSILQIMESLKTSIPDTLNTIAVNSRVNVLLTKSQILHQLANKKEKNADEIFEVANDLIVEFDNFKLQLNELFLKSPGDFELELDQEFEKSQEEAQEKERKGRDSLIELEDPSPF